MRGYPRKTIEETKAFEEELREEFSKLVQKQQKERAAFFQEYSRKTGNKLPEENVSSTVTWYSKF